MAGGSGTVKLTCVLLICMVLTASQRAEGAVSCGQILTRASPCLGYLQRGGPVPPACCDAIKSVNEATRSTPDRQAVCRCIKSLIPSIGGNYGFANALNGKCGINLPYQLTPSFDCSKVK